MRSKRQTSNKPRPQHERDRPSDTPTGPPDERIRRAHEDIERGRVDTDRGPPMNETYERLKHGPGAVPDRSGAGVDKTGVHGPGDRKSSTVDKPR